MPEESVKIFYGYSHADKKVRENLDQHLQPLSELNIVHWDDRAIIPGQEWASEIKDSLNAADIVVLLITASFLHSTYCRKEMDTALIRHNRGEALVIPILLRPVDWDNAPFNKLQVLPTGGLAITEWSNEDKACVDVVKGIRKAVAEVQSRRKAQKHMDEANTHFAQQRYEEAIEAYNEAFRVLPKNSSFDKKRAGILQHEAEAQIKLNNVQKALDTYEDAIRLDPENSQLSSKKGDILFGQRHFEAALVAYEDSLHESPDDPVLYQKKGDTLLNLKRWGEAIDAYKNAINRMSAIEEIPTIVQVYANMGEALFITEKYKEALEAFTAAIEKDSNNARLWRYRGLSCSQLGDIKGARGSYEQAITLKSDNPYFYKEYGDILLRFKCFSEAEAQYTKAILLRSDFGLAYRGRSQAFRALGQKAYEQYERLTRLSDNDEEQFKRFKIRPDR